MNRIKEEVEDRIRKEHAEIRTGKSCADQIFALRNIIYY